MKKIIALAISTILLSSCLFDSSEKNVQTSQKTCLDAGTSTIPSGTKAIRSNGQTTILDSKGCFSFSTPLARILTDSANDSVTFYNDSALFALTIPYVSGVDTIPIVPTIISLQNVPNNIVDSAYLVAYDTVHILQRKVKLKKADYGDSSSYSRTLWSKDNSNNLKIHFLLFGTNTSSSQVYNVEAGSAVIRNYGQIVNPISIYSILTD